MFSKKRETRPKRNHHGNLSQYGLFDVPTDLSMNNEMDDSDGSDSDLETELAMLTAGSSKPKRPARKKVVPNADLDAMVAASMKEIPSDEELSGDDDDPDLLNELSEIAEDAAEAVEAETPSPTKAAAGSPGDLTKMLEERLKMYETAEANAKAAGESSRARRFNRGAKTLKDLIKQAKAGKPIANDDIPPEVSVTVRKPAPADSEPTQPSEPTAIQEDAAPPVPARRAPSIPTSPKVIPIDKPEPQPEPQEPVTLSPENMELLTLLNIRKDQYKVAALQAKKSGDAATAIGYIKIAKQFETVIKAVESGQPVDLSRMPGPPGESSTGPSAAKIEESQVQGHGEVNSAGSQQPSPMEAGEESDEPEPELIKAGSVLEALEQRLAVYKQQEQAAKEQENASKARRMGRIVKQFEQAIKAHKAGKPADFADLPCPPGYAPIPGTEPPKPEPEAAPVASPSPPKREAADDGPKRPPPPERTNSVRASGNHVPTTRSEKQVALLLLRQKEFREAALNAKKKGEMAEAKEYLRTAKGFDPLIDAARGGMPVDMATLPLPPSVKSKLDIDFDLIMKEECQEGDSEDIDMMQRLEKQLTKQLKMCLTTRDHHKALGDIAGMNRFERLAMSVSKDLDVIRLAKRTAGALVPRFHYENKEFSIVKSNTDLNDNDLEMTIVRGINFNCTNPKDIDTYVKYEFPYPQEEPIKDKTATFKDTNNPEYNTMVILQIQRSSKPCLRVFKRHSIKFEVYSKGGFFRGDTLLGTVNVKLQPLETQCELHDSFDLLDGRKKVGGKLEIKLRLRDPLVAKQIEHLNEKWLVLDH